jgi:hypothetical protein
VQLPKDAFKVLAKRPLAKKQSGKGSIFMEMRSLRFARKGGIRGFSANCQNKYYPGEGELERRKMG